MLAFRPRSCVHRHEHVMFRKMCERLTLDILDMKGVATEGVTYVPMPAYKQNANHYEVLS